VAESLPFVGREKHLRELEGAFAQMLMGGPVIYQVHGKSGAGKSVLVQHFLDRLAAGGDVVILSGRCYEKESVPYKAIDSLIDALMHYLLRVGEDQVKALLPDDVAALTRIFPVLNRVGAMARSGRGLAGAEASHVADLRALRERAFSALRELLFRIGSQRPLVLYLDDLQWGDLDSAALLSAVLRPPGAPRLLLLIAYRSEYARTSPCLAALAGVGIGTGGVAAHGSLAVEALSPEETRQLALALLLGPEPVEGARPEPVEPARPEPAEPTRPEPAEGAERPPAHRFDRDAEADWVVRESGGSALFIYELVRHLKTGMTRASAEGVNLDEVLWNRITRLPTLQRELLEVVAVAGKPLALRAVQVATHSTALPPEAVTSLRAAHLVRTTGPHLDDQIETYHDRVRESILARLGAESRRAWHGGLADALEADPQPDLEALAAHSEGAGRRAKAGRHYLAAAAGAVQVLAFERAEELYQKAASLAQSEMDRVAVYERMIHFYTDMARFSDAYEMGRRGTELLGVRLPARFFPPLFMVDYIKSKIRLRRRKAAELTGLPTMSNPRLEAVVRLINAVGKAAYQVRPELCVAISTKSVNLCLKHGNTRDCAVGYMVYGSIFQGGVLGNHPVGDDFGRLVLSLVEQHGNTAQRAEVHFVVGYFGTSWMRPVRQAEALWKIAYQAGLETRDLFHTGCAAAGIIMSYHMRGVPMDEVWIESEGYLEFLRRVGQREPVAVITGVRQFIRNLRGQTHRRDSFADDAFDEAAHVRQLAGFGSRHFAHFYYVLKTQALYLWGEFDLALDASRLSGRYLKDSPGMLHAAEHHYQYALVLAALYPRMTPARQWSCWRAIKKIHRRFQKWSRQCEANFGHKERLLSAEIARLSDRHKEAARDYDQSIASAAGHGYIHVQALAHDRAASLYQLMNEPAQASSHVQAAVDCYRRWGASALADDLKSRRRPE
jgi:predicted ATPase